jgi:hypothetical protein
LISLTIDFGVSKSKRRIEARAVDGHGKLPIAATVDQDFLDRLE